MSDDASWNFPEHSNWCDECDEDTFHATCPDCRDKQEADAVAKRTREIRDAIVRESDRVFKTGDTVKQDQNNFYTGALWGIRLCLDYFNDGAKFEVKEVITAYENPTKSKEIG